MERVNFFIYGMSGSGKDTIANSLRDDKDFLKLRIAGTIKQFVFETYGFKSQEEFESSKRSNPEVRKAHNTFGKYYDETGIERSNNEATTNRIKSLINKSALEFEISRDNKEKDICIVDVRNLFEAQLLLEGGFNGIFLSRRSDEYKDSKHKTEQDIIKNGELLLFLKQNKQYLNHAMIIFNTDDFNENDCNFWSWRNIGPEGINLKVTEGSPDELILLVQNWLSILKILQENKSNK